MASYNRVILVGNLTRAPELRHAPSGTAVANFRLAVSETFRGRQDGQTKEVVCYVDVAVWDRQAETCNQYLAKGSPVLVEGRLVYDEWKNPQGETRNRLSVRADRVQFLAGSGQKRHEAAEDGPVPAPPAKAAEGAATSAEAGVVQPEGDRESRDEEDLPF